MLDWKVFTDIINAVQTSLRLAALMVLIVGAVGLAFFRRGPVWAQLVAFLVMAGGTGLFIRATESTPVSSTSSTMTFMTTSSSLMARVRGSTTTTSLEPLPTGSIGYPPAGTKFKIADLKLGGAVPTSQFTLRVGGDCSGPFRHLWLISQDEEHQGQFWPEVEVFPERGKWATAIEFPWIPDSRPFDLLLAEVSDQDNMELRADAKQKEHPGPLGGMKADIPPFVMHRARVLDSKRYFFDIE
jgi:hypothetical protein